MAIVFVTNDGGQRYEPAKKFGDLIALTAGNVNIFATDRIIADFKIKLSKAEWSDYLLLSGSPILNAIAMNILLQKNKIVNVLLYHAKDGEYLQSIIKLEDLNYEGDIPLAQGIDEDKKGKESKPKTKKEKKND